MGEKDLRALLAEAREWVGSGGPPTIEARLSVGPLRARIDAALRMSEDQISIECLREDAFTRGAEAMREAAASCIGSDTALLQTYRSVLEGRIRDLPVPEDKP